MDYTITRHVSTIKKWSSTTLELNIIKWGDNPEKYDLRRWKNNIPGRRGVTLAADELRSLYAAISEELKYIETADDEFVLTDDDVEDFGDDQF